MNIFDEWLRLYPLWPHDILSKFSSQIKITLDAISNASSNEKEYYQNALPTSIVTSFAESSKTFTLLNPPSRFARSAYINFGEVFIAHTYPLSNLANAEMLLSASGIAYDYVFTRFSAYREYNYITIQKVTPKIIYDVRLYKDLQVSYKINYYNTDSPYPNDRLAANTLFQNVTSDLTYIIKGIEPYNGVKSLLALHENGLSCPNLDFNACAEFETFRIAYEKYLGELSAAAALSAQQSQSDLQQYKTILSQKLIDEARQIQNTKLQLSVALQNEVASAKRDYQNLLLNAQNLAISMKQAGEKLCL